MKINVILIKCNDHGLLPWIHKNNSRRYSFPSRPLIQEWVIRHGLRGSLTCAVKLRRFGGGGRWQGGAFPCICRCKDVAPPAGKISPVQQTTQPRGQLWPITRKATACRRARRAGKELAPAAGPTATSQAGLRASVAVWGEQWTAKYIQRIIEWRSTSSSCCSIGWYCRANGELIPAEHESINISSNLHLAWRIIGETLHSVALMTISFKHY